jgi:hypothetical protein
MESVIFILTPNKAYNIWLSNGWIQFEMFSNGADKKCPCFENILGLCSYLALTKWNKTNNRLISQTAASWEQSYPFGGGGGADVIMAKKTTRTCGCAILKI